MTTMQASRAAVISPCCGARLAGGPDVFWCRKCGHDVPPESGSPSRPDPCRAWVLAARDIEHDAWEALYEALHPRPATPMSGAAGRVTGLTRPRRAFQDAAL